MRKCLLLLLFALSLPLAAEEFSWKGKGDAFTRDKTGIYLWWQPGLQPNPGTWRLTGRLRAAKEMRFTVGAHDAVSGKKIWSGGATVGTEYGEVDFGVFTYDGSYLLRFADWNEPGFYLESFKLTPVEVPELPEERRANADSLAGWLPMRHTRITLDEAVKKEGKASLQIGVKGAEKSPWYDLGVSRRMPVKELKMLSFWLRWEGAPSRLWVNLVTATGSAVATVDVNQFGLQPGEWKLIEIPAQSFHFKPPRSVVKEVRAISISPEPAAEALFRIDDLLIE